MLTSFKYMLLAEGSILISIRPGDTHRRMQEDAGVSYDEILSAGSGMYLTRAKECEITPAFAYQSKTPPGLAEEIESRIKKSHDKLMQMIAEAGK